MRELLAEMVHVQRFLYILVLRKPQVIRQLGTNVICHRST